LKRQARGAAKEYHDAIQKRKEHWEDFLADNVYIWQAAKYLNSSGNSMFDKVPSLKGANGSSTNDKLKQAVELLATFFPSPLEVFENEGPRPQRPAMPMLRITMEKVERRMCVAKPWKVLGDDSLPAMVWKQVWPAAKDKVLLLFQTSLDSGELPV